MRKVLIVEDDKFLSAIFSLFIKDLGHDLIGRCQSGIHALELCNAEKPDVVLMDIHLEGEIDGIETAERIQREFEVPVIFVTSDTSTDIVERAITSNSYGYLVKPVQKNELGISIDLAYYKHKVALEQKHREQGFRQFLSEAPAPVIILQNGRIQYLNMNALDLFHTHYIEDMIGLPFLNFVDSSFHSQIKKSLEESDENGDLAIRHDIVVTGLHGKPLDVAMGCSRVNFNGKKAIQIILTDITDQKSAVRDCQILREALFRGGKGVMIINSDLKISDISPGFKNHLNLNGNSSLNDFDIDLNLIQDLINNEVDNPFDIQIAADGKVFKCKAITIGRKGQNNREVILKIEN